MTIDDLETMDRAALVAAWSDLVGTPVPKGLSQTLIRRILATEVQARQHGGLPARVKAALRRGGGQRKSSRPRSPGVKPGWRLLREWNGVTHVVEVGDDGYHWKGKRYRSLSAIAREITGAHWSGPRFFGLNRKPGR